MAQQDTKTEELQALRSRALVGLFFAASANPSESHNAAFSFWQGYIKAADDIASGCGSTLAGLDGASSGYQAPSVFQRALATLPKHIEHAPLSEVQKFLASCGVEIAAHAVSNSDINAAEDLKNGASMAVDLDNKHPAPGIDRNDCSLHSAPDGETAIVATEGGAA